MTGRIRAMTVVCLAAAIVAAPSSVVAAAGNNLNILFIAVDDMRPELGCYGAKYMQTPNIDRLANRGLLFERAYCQVAVCNPSRNSVLSGMRPDTTKIFNNQTFLRQTMPDVVTLPQHFKQNGYTTLSLGKIFHHSEREPGDDPKSWSEPSWYHGTPYRSWFTKESDDLIKRLKALPEKERPKLFRGPPYEAADEPDESYPDAKLATKAVETLERLKTEGKPFFLGVGFQKPHLPFTCPQKYWDLYPPASIRNPETNAATKDAPAAAFHTWYELRSYGGIPPTGDISTEQALNLIRGYRACTSFMDAQVGRVLDALERLGLRDDTLIVLWGDHGYHLGENGVWTKMTNFERGTRVPLIVALPNQTTAGRRTKALVELVDLYPTLVGLCELPASPQLLEGWNFGPLLGDPDLEWKSAVFSQYLRPGKEPAMGRSMRTDRYRYTEWTNPKGDVVGRELYDQERDVGEYENMVDDPRNQEIVVELKRKLKAGWHLSGPPTYRRRAN